MYVYNNCFDEVNNASPVQNKNIKSLHFSIALEIGDFFLIP